MGAGLRRLGHRDGRRRAADRAAALAPAVRGLGRARLHRLPHLVRPDPLRPRGHGRGGRPGRALVLGRGRPPPSAMAASSLPLAADYTHACSRSRRAAFWRTSVGYFVPLVLLYGLERARALLAQGSRSRAPSSPPSRPAEPPARWPCSRSRWTRPTSRSPTSARRRSRSRTSSPWASQRVLVVLVAGRRHARSGRRRRASPTRPSCFCSARSSSRCSASSRLTSSSAPGRPVWNVRWSGIAAWAAGFALFQWIHPIGPAWWVDQAAQDPWSGRRRASGPSLPAFALAFALYAGVRSAHAPLRRRRARLARSR